MKLRIVLILAVLLSCVPCKAVTQDFVTLNWSDRPVYTYEPYAVQRPFNFDGAAFDDGDPFPHYTQTIRLGSGYSGGDIRVTVEFPSYEPLPTWQQDVMDRLGLTLGPGLKVEQDIRYVSGEAYLVVRMVPMAYHEGRYCRVTSFRLRVIETATHRAPGRAAQADATAYPDSSVLASGRWVKIRVGETGVYSISYSRLASMGFNDPSRVAVYGYGGNLLQEDFSKGTYCNDLPEVPVRLTGSALLFFAEGPLRQDPASDVRGLYWQPVTNYCSDYGYYFLTEKDSPLAFTQPDSAGSTGNEIDSFVDYIYYKGDELFTWADFGRRIYDSYDFRNGRSREYDFTLDGLVHGTDVRIDVAFATASSSLNSYLEISANGEQLGRSTDMRVASSSQYIFARRTLTTCMWDTADTDELRVGLRHSTSGNMSAHLEYILINYTRRLEMTSSTLLFSNMDAAGDETYVIDNITASTEVWDITTPGAYRQMQLTVEGTQGRFTDDTGGTRRFVAVNTDAPLNDGITVIGEVANQNLHSLRDVDMVILIPANGAMYDTAERLAQWHRDNDGMTVVTVNAGDVYNEFSSGTPDVTAYRRLMKMLYDTASDRERTKYLLLFGDCVYDNRMRTSTWNGYSTGNFLLSYQPFESENEQNNFQTDDYWGFLDDGEGGNITDARNTVDIGIGRFPVRTVSEASGIVDKLIGYMQNTEKGSWKNNICWVADDNLDDGGTIHMEQSNELIDYVEGLKEGYMTERLFLDLYKRESSSTGYTYPQAVARLREVFNDGALVLSYIGHSNADFWTSKRILTANDVSSLRSTRLPLWITASCDYARVDAFSTSAGELALLNPNGAAVGLFTTTRVVYISDNQRINRLYNRFVYERKADGTHYTLGEIQMRTKQERAISGSEDRNDLNFIFLGDPALRLNYPDAHKVVVDSVNGVAAAEKTQIKAGSVIEVKGHVSSLDGSPLTDFDGMVETVAMDSKKLVTSLNNAGYVYDSGPDTIQFMARTNRLFIGSDSVAAGNFVMQFAVPLDINYSDDEGLLNFYAWNDSVEANAQFENFIIGGAVDSINTDGVGPEIYAYLNTPDFVYGGQVNESPVLYATFYDEDGMNISDSGLGHNIVAIIDDDPNMTFALNDYYTQGDSYRNGNVVYKFSNLPSGKHVMRLRAWDIFNNSSTSVIEFEVVQGLKPVITQVSCISPATGQTTFFVTHDRPDTAVEVMLEIFDYAGSALYRANIDDRTSSGIYTYDWDLCDATGARLQPGIYIYRVTLSAEGGESESKTGKIVIIGQ